MTHAHAIRAETGEAAGGPFDRHHGPSGPVTGGQHAHPIATMPDAVRHCRWIAADIGAAGFGVFLASPSPERDRLVAFFDSDYPSVSVATKFMSGANGEEMVRHTRISTEPRWWSDDGVPGSDARFRSMAWAAPTTPLVPGTTGIAFPVHAERGQCGLVVFFGPDIALRQDQLYEIHARCFSLFASVARIRPGDAGRARTISKRELECLRLTANGYTSEAIAKLLKLSVHTANQYLTQCAQKLNAVSRTQAVAKALRLGLIE